MSADSAPPSEMAVHPRSADPTARHSSARTISVPPAKTSASTAGLLARPSDIASAFLDTWINAASCPRLRSEDQRTNPAEIARIVFNSNFTSSSRRSLPSGSQYRRMDASSPRGNKRARRPSRSRVSNSAGNRCLSPALGSPLHESNQRSTESSFQPVWRSRGLSWHRSDCVARCEPARSGWDEFRWRWWQRLDGFIKRPSSEGVAFRCVF